MSYRPCGAEHAVDEVSFVFACTRSLSEADIEAIRGYRNEIRAELPAISGLGDEPGIRLGYIRTNGTPVWQVRAAGNTITIDCSRYTRWDRIWERASRYADLVLRACAQQQPIQIGGMGLNVIDRFECDEPECDLQTLFTRNDLIPLSLFDHSSMWSLDYRWISQQTHGILAQGLEINRQGATRFERKSGDTKSIIVVIVEHSQELQLQTPIEVGAGEERKMESSNQIMCGLHGINKQLVDKLLVSEMKEKIGLWRAA